MAKREIKTKKTEETVVETPQVEETVNSTEVEVTESKQVVGIVTGCSRLNVRKKPFLNADIITELKVNNEVTIDNDKSNNDWYCVTTADGVNGFCMKKYISVK